ncbi:unnamed protein product [Linum trigynum]|uniref:NAD(P)H-quinone oxidoreductase subunit M, chloroplastic n=1 Tax=Linum trigynum TaxID=586398 RepID=A0AAV2GT60_9ROSI
MAAASSSYMAFSTAHMVGKRQLRNNSKRAGGATDQREEQEHGERVRRGVAEQHHSHVRIFAAYIDPVTCEMDQTQMDKLTLILDPTNEFVWDDVTCTKVYSYFQELVDHYEGAPLTEYTLRLIGSDIEHYIRKLLYNGEIKYNMRAKTLNFSMGKPRIIFNDGDKGSSPDVQ